MSDPFEELRKKLGKHHVWCNFFLEQPAATCTMCSDLKKQYPEESKTPDELLKEHFPNVKKVDI